MVSEYWDELNRLKPMFKDLLDDDGGKKYAWVYCTTFPVIVLFILKVV